MLRRNPPNKLHIEGLKVEGRDLLNTGGSTERNHGTSREEIQLSSMEPGMQRCTSLFRRNCQLGEQLSTAYGIFLLQGSVVWRRFSSFLLKFIINRTGKRKKKKDGKFCFFVSPCCNHSTFSYPQKFVWALRGLSSQF